MPVAKKSQTKYRLVFDTEFQPQWETFVLECRKRGLTPDRQIQTLVAGFNRSGESDSSPAKPAPTKASLMASPLASAHDVDSEPEGTSSKPPAKPPAQPTRQTEAKGPRNIRRKKRPTPATRKTPGTDRPPVPVRSKGGPAEPRMGARKRKVTRGTGSPGSPEGQTGFAELPSPEPKELSDIDGPRGRPGSLPPLNPEGSSPPLTAVRRTKRKSQVAVQIPAHQSPKYQLLELMKQLDVERNGLERDDVLSEARSNSISSPELNLNKLIRRGLVHIYEGRCRTT